MAKPFYVYDDETLKEIIRDEAKRTVETKIVPKIKKNISDEAKKAKGPHSRKQAKGKKSNIKGNTTYGAGLGVLKNITSETVFGDGLKALKSKTTASNPEMLIAFIQDETKPQPHIFYKGVTSEDPTIFSQWVNDGSWMDLSAYVQSGYKDKVKREARPYFDKAYEKTKSELPEYRELIANDLCSRLGVTRLP